MEPLTLSLLFLLIGLFLGGVAGFWYARLRGRADVISRSELQAAYVSREVFENIERQLDTSRDELRDRIAAQQEDAARLAAARQDITHLHDRIHQQAAFLEEIQKENRQQFESLAGRLLEEKSRKFTDQNQEQLSHLLTPLKEKIAEFEQQVQRTYADGLRDHTSLKKEIEQLRQLNQQLSADAHHLATALKGDNKRQGDWGEWQLKTLMESAGLHDKYHFDLQNSYRDENGRQKRPDVIVNLPHNRQIIIDCKVSLLAYENYCRAEDAAEQDRHCREHVNSLRRHIRDLAGKHYESLSQVNSPGFVFLFVPLEPALSLATQTDRQLFREALEANIILTSTSTLLASLRTIDHLWQQERQQQNAEEIAELGGKLYDKFAGFVDDLQQIGQRLDQARDSYHMAFNKLSKSPKQGTTLLARAEQLSRLGVKHKKQLPAGLTGHLPPNGTEEEEEAC